ncbi:hypothetical protein [Pseudobacter ginsenosidimutans]|uniref:Uncharacterized protein n=1 Tax=Pseudobacter ginsenosidimutans TaxID=661488 RepID=A0A4Q7MVX5_9BACT|nr:hypothetical protein [Pseudobacter ginsenosidimutans]RZS72189.1 hypothetical protein EV199_4105 [Pseudobacter ginsenosidimutans]
MKLVLFVLLVSLISSLIESRKKKRKKVEIDDHKEPLHPAAFSLR